MELKSGTLDNWRSYFGTANADIFDIIDHAIMVAVSDHANEFRVRRDKIAELLFSCKTTECVRCDRVELAVPREIDVGVCKSGKSGIERQGFEFVSGGSKESRVNGSEGDCAEINGNPVNTFSLGDSELEALSDQIEEAHKTLQEVLRIKDIILMSQDKSESELGDCLRRLHLMALNVDVLQETEIGKAVSGLRKHASKRIRVFARNLVAAWKELADEWVNAARTIPGGNLDSVHPSVPDDEVGLFSPPMDEIFFATPPLLLDFSHFFDGIDDFGNPQESREFKEDPEGEQKPTMKNKNVIRRKRDGPIETDTLAKDKGQLIKKQGAIQRRKPSNAEPGHGRPLKMNGELHNKQDKPGFSEEVGAQLKLEATKRKLHENYRQVNDAKRQRTVQIMELSDIPKHGSRNKNPHVRPGRHQPNRRL